MSPISVRSGFKNTYMLCMLILFTGSSLRAQELPRGPNQGTLKKAGDYYIEMLGCMDHMEIYVYDRDQQSMSNVDLSGDVKFMTGKKEITVLLTPYGREGFTAKLPPGVFDYSIIGIRAKNKRVEAQFGNECVKGK
jgi:hypothetical protein